jgi:acetyltransferase
MGTLVKRAELLSSPTSVPEEFHDVDSKKVAELLRKSRIGADGFMAASSASQILSAYGVQIPREMVAMSKAEAIELAEKLGFPVTLKINSVDLPHKSELGGVHIDLQDSDHISEAFTKIIRECKDHLPGVEGIQVLVQEMVYGGQEVVVGVVRDMHFGPLVMFGSGGMEVEVLNDTAFALAPLCRSEVAEMLEKTWAGRKLQGFRNIEAADRDAVIETVLRVGQLAEDFPQIEELEINPLIVLPQGNGAIAVDVRMKVVKE